MFFNSVQMSSIPNTLCVNCGNSLNSTSFENVSSLIPTSNLYNILPDNVVDSNDNFETYNHPKI